MEALNNTNTHPNVPNASGIVTSADGTRNVTILCCHCGTPFSASSTGTNICIKCLTTQADITGGITKNGTLEFCRKCERYLRPPWIRAEHESKELLDICLKKIRGLNKVKLIDANFVWTEPHSRRVKVKLTIQKEVMNNTSIQQSMVTEFCIDYLQCDDCRKDFTPHTWRALVQVRQRVDHKKTFFFIEQLILRQKIHDKMINIEEVAGGIDFFFKERAHAVKLVEFLQSVLPTKAKSSKQLISYKEHENIYNYKYVFSVELPKVCKEDLVIIKPRLASSLGGCGRLLLCTKVASVIQFIDVLQLKVIEMSGPQFFQSEPDMVVIPSKGNLSEFMVFDIEIPGSKNQSSSFVGTKWKASTATVGRVTDWQNFEVKTHLGDMLTEGSSVMAYDMTCLNFEGYAQGLPDLKNVPDVIIVKKIYPEKRKSKKRIWKLKHLEKQEKGVNHIHKANVQKDKDDKDYEEFLYDIETNPELRAHINLYKDPKALKEPTGGPTTGEESKSEAHTETDSTVDKVERKRHKPKVRGKKTKKGAQQPEKEKEEVEDHREVEEAINEDKVKNPKEEDVGDVKLEELLNDLDLDDEVVKIGTKVGEDPEEPEGEDSVHHDIEEDAEVHKVEDKTE